MVSTNGFNNYLTHDFTSWRDFSRTNPEPEMVHTISVSIRVPRIIVLLLFERLPKKEVKFTRHNVFERDRNTCQYCGKVFDRHELTLITFCRETVGDRLPGEHCLLMYSVQYQEGQSVPHEAGLQLIRKPRRPKWRPFVNISFSWSHHDSWKHFLDLAYWNVELGQ